MLLMATQRLSQPRPPTATASGGSLDGAVRAGFRLWATA